jgi:hypothetical protein
MNKILAAILGVLMVMTGTSSAQLNFAVKPGLTGNSGQFGINVGGVMVFGGMEYFRTTITVDESGSNLIYNYNYSTYPYTMSVAWQAYSNSTLNSVNVYAPFVGAKILFGGREANKTGAYLIGIIGKPLFSGKSISNGKESSNTFFENLSTWMFMAGFGGEYFFSESFSIGGEFGLRVVLVNYKDDANDVTQAYDPGTGTYRSYSAPHKYNLDLGMGITYSTLVLNYYL